MRQEDYGYHRRRAIDELFSASSAASPLAARAHFRLAMLHLTSLGTMGRADRSPA